MVAKQLYEDRGRRSDWSTLTDDRRAGWFGDADLVVPTVLKFVASLVDGGHISSASNIRGIYITCPRCERLHCEYLNHPEIPDCSAPS